MAQAQTFDCVVRFTAGAHVTNVVRGQRASSTMGAEWAVKALAAKVFRVPATKVHLVSAANVQPQVWRAVA